MEQQTIAGLLERYWRAETTVAEERLLAAYFRQPDIAPEWEYCRQLFAYYDEEAKLEPGEDLGDRIMERIRELDGEQDPGNVKDRPLSGEERRPPVRSIRRINWSYAAAAIVILGFSLFLMVPDFTGKKQPGSLADSGRSYQGAVTANSGAVHSGAISPATVKDTYDNPEQALAAIQKALLTVSVKMNRGRHITQQHMDRLNDSWNAAITN